MSWLDSLHITPGITAAIGSGGKSTLLGAAGAELARRGGVILATTTHMLPFAGVPLYTGSNTIELAGLVERECLVCVGTLGANGKLSTSPITMDELAKLATYVLVEADGSKRLPLKAHASHEPQVPAQAQQTILVIGASGFGGVAREAAHRPELFCPRAGITEAERVSPEAVALCIVSEIAAGLIAPTRILINQAEASTPEAIQRFARELRASHPHIPVLSASLNQRRIELVP